MAAVVVGVVGTRATVIDTVKFDGFDIVCWRDQPLLSPGDTGRIRDYSYSMLCTYQNGR